MIEQGHDPASPEAAATAAVALQAALALCRQRGTQMTVLRRAMLEALWQAHRPLGAYDLLFRLEGILGRKLTPASIYRVLEFLVGEGLAARIESRNGYVPCAHPERVHGCVFFVCDRCTHSVEIEDQALEALIERDAQGLGFQISRRVIELQGICARCRQGPPDASVGD
ncbi:MAG: Fur family transcriptional regulator [Rhodospirillales bacterium]